MISPFKHSPLLRRSRFLAAHSPAANKSRAGRNFGWRFSPKPHLPFR